MDFDSLLPIPNSQHTANDHINDDAQLPLAGCVWLANSCAYDMFFMLMFSMYKDSSQAWRQVLTDAGPWFTFISEMFEYLMIPANLSNPLYFSKCRDDLRSMLSVHDDHLFPRPSQEHMSIFQVFEVFENNSNHSQTLSQVFACDHGCFEKCNALHLPGTCQQSVWTNVARRVNLEYGLDNASIQIFIDCKLLRKLDGDRPLNVINAIVVFAHPRCFFPPLLHGYSLGFLLVYTLNQKSQKCLKSEVKLVQ